MRHLPSPPQLGLDPDKFPAWRAHQDTGIITIHEAPTKFVGILAPTGFGKSAMIVGHALWSGKRVLIVTANRGLMAQYEADFGPMLAVIKGQSNYNCEIAMVTVDHAPCHAGQLCELKQAGCTFFGATGAKQMAKDAQLVLTNYQFLFHSMKEIEGIGHFDLVCYDEAHQAPRELSKFLSIGISRRESRDILRSSPDDDWNIWAQGHLSIVTRQLRTLKKKKGRSPQLIQEVHQYRGLRRKLATLARAHTDRWVMTPGRFEGEMNWDCIRPAGYAKFYMWKRADKFLLTSASVRPHLFPALGVKADLTTWREFPSTIPVERRPVYYYPVIKYHAYSSAEEIRYLIAVMDQIIERRRDRKGTINSVSYERAAMFKANSKFGRYMITHSNADELPGAIAKFAAAKAPAILVSPSISEGYNFAYSAAEYTIIPKVPFSDTRSPIHKARAKTDRHYGILETCVEIRQSVGRIVRADDDQGEAFILDEQFGWVYRQHRRFFPADFIAAVKPIQYLPAPPRRLK